MKTSRLQTFTSKVQGSFQEFFSRSTSAGIVIIGCSALALLWANTSLASAYEALLHQPVDIRFFTLSLQFTFEHFVNDGLMALFFLLVGLEIKRELLIGELSSAKKAILPIVAAIAGMIAPGLIYALFTFGSDSLHGWGIPVATDIAFALGILALLGNRVPLGLKVFLAALAIADDLLAIGIIAVFYTDTLNTTALIGVAATVLALVLVRRAGIRDLRIYAAVGTALWFFVYHSGIHATVAGVILAAMMPARSRITVHDFIEELGTLTRQLLGQNTFNEDEGKRLDIVHAIEKRTEEVQSPLQRMQRLLQIPVDYGVLPLFALVNAGVVLNTEVVQNIGSPVSLGIIVGLVVGKQLGITLAVWLSLRLGIAALPEGATMRHMHGVAVLCGIGFTMSLFVSQLAFDPGIHLDVAKVSVFIASVLSAIGGLAILHAWLPRTNVGLKA